MPAAGSLPKSIARPGLIVQAVAPTVEAILLSVAGARQTLFVLAALAIVNLALVVLLWGSVRRRREYDNAR